jgi:hypothetical protein
MNFKAASFEATLKNFILVTHAVPAERVRPFLPNEIKLQTFIRDGIETAFISAGVFYNNKFHWEAATVPQMNFFQSTHRAYVTYKGLPGVYFFKNLLGTLPSYLLQRVFCQDARLAAFDLRRFSDEAFDVKINGADGVTHFTTEGGDASKRTWMPFEDDHALDQFITYRLFGFFKGPRGLLMNQRVSHLPMTPKRVRLETARFEIWENFGFLKPEEQAEAFVVHVQPAIEFHMLPPFPAKIISPVNWQHLNPAAV